VSQQNPQSPRKRILVAEDDPEIAELLARILGAHYDVAVVNDGHRALAVLSKPPVPDLVLLDVMMPGVDGFGVAQRLRLLHPNRKIPVIFVTARDAPLDVIQGIQAGARHYITKPFKVKDVLDKVARAVGGPLP